MTSTSSTSPSAPSGTSDRVWTLGSQRKSSAVETISKLARTVYLAKSAISSATTQVQLSALSERLKRANYLLGQAKIEQAMARASPKQVKAVGAMLSGDYNVVCLSGGNQSGKSYCGGMIAASAIRDDLPPGATCWCVSPNLELSIKTPQRYLWEFLPHEKISASYNSKTGFGQVNPQFTYDPRTPDNPNGRNITVYFKTEAQYQNDPDSFESATVTGFVWVDESIGEICWNAIQPRIAIHNVPVIVTTIPRMDWMYDAFEEADPEARVYFDKLFPLDNPAMTPEALKRLELGIQSEEERDMRIHGKFMFFGGLVYREFRKDYKPHGHLVRPFPIPAHWPRWRAMDVGMDHPTVCLWCTVAPNDNLYVYREYRSRHTPILKDAERILTMSEGDTFASPTLIDPSAYAVTKANERSVAQQYQDAGLPMRPAVRVGSGIKEWPLVQMVKRALINERLFVFDTCEGLIKEFRKWKFKRDQHNEPVGDSFEDKNNDGLDALKYWVADGPAYHRTEYVEECTIPD